MCGLSTFGKSRLVLTADRISWRNEKSDNEILLKDFTIQPQSAQTIQILNKHELHLRLQLANLKEFVNDEYDSQLEYILSCSGQDQMLKIHCKQCQYPITHQNRVFSRVLELPSENWQEYLDNWCCHGNDAIFKLKDCTNPREHDCFLGDWYIVLHPLAINTNNVFLSMKDNNGVSCGKCKAKLGEVTTTEQRTTRRLSPELIKYVSVKLFKHSISLYATVSPILQDIFTGFGEEKYLARKFKSLSKTCLCHKFIVNKITAAKQTNDLSILLIWILNIDTKFVSSLHSTQHSRKYEEWTMNAFSGVKVLFKLFLDDDFIKKQNEWHKNDRYDVVDLPEVISLRLISFLHKNNKILPQSLRNVNNFKVSFLKL
ncbi:E3 ubiquitin-protein ligase E3D-like isoform X2 [Xenia sp. Carnegie-2017]|uniref:E3 ubiquitin-protein ligase E3D-like isoform X2 n=1 Tax=Xenia sp. Carnegie-2017 TaxID=2897299 RepID=UPI001F046570|nr:E3 ubiquitin-protein ligase E3D-like isoform X2 [Xenia sp. Carnegie-2017]XP_046848277.1 E3 ubiquitin-protein ligase E3D-like isoform X2 [Xenia sp. Carnegie-2017]